MEKMAPERFADMSATRMAGIGIVLIDDAPTAIPELWRRFGAGLAQTAAVGQANFGICTSKNGEMHYLAGTAVGDDARMPAGWEQIKLPARRYAVFPHNGDLTTIRETIERAGEWLEHSGQSPEASAAFLERYGPGFDPVKGKGDIEIWMPLKA